MRILCAPDSFKGTLSAQEAAEAMREGIGRIDRTIGVDLCPVSDGGEGFLEVLEGAGGAERRRVEVTGPLGDRVAAVWGCVGESGQCTAILESAQAVGLTLVPPEQRTPMRTTSYGLGELIAAALEARCRRIVIGLGGSATCDGGIGMASALGAEFGLGERRLTGADLAHVERVELGELTKRLGDVEIIAAYDVSNPLLGPEGAAAVFAPQKGASAEEVSALEAGLARLAALMPETDAMRAGTGAAGGLGFGLSAFFGAELRSGIELVLSRVGFDQRAAEADLVLTGEGRFDSQTASGKAAFGVAQAAAGHGVPTIALCGSAAEASGRHPFVMVRTIVDDLGISVEEATAQAAARLADLTEVVLRGVLDE